MLYVKKECPQCGYVYEKNTYGGYPSKENRIRYGSPLRKCINCGNMFLDDEYREIAIDGIRGVDTMRISPATILLSCFAVIMGISTIWSWNELIGIVILGTGIFFFVDEWTEYENRQKKLEIQIQESEERMKSAAYAFVLKKLGYDVPDRFLDPEKLKKEIDGSARGVVMPTEGEISGEK